MLNYFEALGLSVKEIEGQGEAAIAEKVDAAHEKLYARTIGSYANMPRADGRTQAQWQEILNAAQETLKDPQKRREHIAELPETKESAKKAAEKKAAKREASKKAAAAKWAEIKQSVVMPSVEFVLKHAEIISAIGVVLVLLGTALQAYFGASMGAGIYGLGAMILPAGGTAFLYKGSQQQIMVFGAAGIILLLLGFVMQSMLLGPPLAGLGGTVFMCGLAALVFKQSWHLKIMEVARRAAAGWMDLSATWSPVFRIGATGLVLALTLLVVSIPLAFLSGGVSQVIFGPIIGLLFSGGLFLVAAGTVWWLITRRWDIVECQGCEAKMTRTQYYRKVGGHWNGCPACGTNLDPILTGRRRGIFS